MTTMKITDSEKAMFSVLRREAGVISIKELAAELGVTPNSCQVKLSALRKKFREIGKVLPEPRKLARGKGGASEDLESFLDGLDEIE